MSKLSKKPERREENEAWAVKKAEKQYIKQCLIAAVIVLCLALPAGKNDVPPKIPHEQ